MTEIKEQSKVETPKKTPTGGVFDELYKKLSKPIPKEFLVEYTQDGKKFTGYHSQYAIDLLNEVVGLGNWNTECEIDKKEFISKGWVVAGGVTIHIELNGQSFGVIGFGGSYAKDIANAYKGFKTSAFKNACRYLGIGKELYVKGFEDDIVEEESSSTIVTIEDNELAQKIDQSENIGALEQYKDAIQAVEGKAVKDVLIKKYNEKKIELIEKK